MAKTATREYRTVARDERPLVTSLLVGLFIAGPTLGLLGLALPHAPDVDELGIFCLAGGAYLAAGFIFLIHTRMPEWGFEVAAAYGSLLISASIYFSGATIVTGAFYYLWVVLGAAYFFERRRVALQLLVVAGGYGIALIAKPPIPGAIQAWIVAVGTLSIAALLFMVTRERVTALVDRLAEAADTDPLTDLLNRRGFAKQLELELERAERAEGDLSVIYGDLDHFKDINDRFGHQVGDDVLVEVGDLLRRHARRIDCVARVGGEEFALLVPSSAGRGAFITAERLRYRVREALASRYPGLTISFGIASFPVDAASPERLLRCADESLYAAKTLGRDRSVIYSREIVGALAAKPEHAPTAAVANLSTLLALAEALDIRDHPTARHSETVARYAEAMALELGMDPEHVERVRLAAVLHDIGKIGIADSVLHKEGPLSESEWAELRNHPEIGARLLSAPGFDDLRAWVLAHHEHLDGSGYPLGLKGDEIPLEARILAIADAFEAMLADRPYRPGRPEHEALDELHRASGTQFDPAVVEALVASLDRLPAPRPE